MLKSVTLKNFKSFREATLKLSPTVTFLIGANASGKTNALEALRFLSWLGQGKSLREIEDIVSSDSSAIRGPAADLVRRGETSMSIEASVGTDEEDLLFSTSIGFLEPEAKAALAFQAEALTDADGKRLYSADADGEIASFVKAYSGTNGQALFYTLHSFLGLLPDGTPLQSLKAAAPGLLRLRQAFTNMCFCNFQPEHMRGYRKCQTTFQLDESGDNLSAALERLCQDDAVKSRVLAFVQALPEQKIQDIRFSRTDMGYVMVILDEGEPAIHNAMTSYLLSDGTLRALAIAAALLGAPEGSLVVIEEVDNGIHPSRIQHLVDSMYAIAAERHIQILVTTHDPAMMDAIPPQEKGNILCCHRSKEDGASAILRLQDSPNCVDFVTNDHLGRFVATELFEKLVKQPPEEQAQEHEIWFKQFVKEEEEYRKALEKMMAEE